MPCIIDIVQATTKRGPTLRRFNEPRGSTRASNTAHGVASSVPNSCRRQVKLSHKNTGVPVVSPTPTWTCSSRSTASISSSSSDSSRIPASTVRYAAELGYEVTVVKDATADYSDEMMHAALDINIPNYASAIVTTSQIVASISAANVMDGALRQ